MPAKSIPQAVRFHRLRIPVRPLALALWGAALLSGQAGHPVEIVAFHQAVSHDKTRVVIEFNGEFEYHSNRLHAPERLYFDFAKVKARAGLRSIYPQDSATEIISRIRMAEPVPDTTRVVLDLLGDVEVSTEVLKNPYRLQVELSPVSAPVPPARSNAPASEDDPPRNDSSQGAASLKPVNLEPPNVTGPAEPVQSEPVLNRRHSLTLSSATAAPGSVAEVQLALESPAGEEPQALQWELSYPSPKLGIEEGDLAAGSVAGAAGKSLACAGRVESAAEYIYRCIVAGGLQVIPNGTVATIHFHVRPHAEPGDATVRIANAMAVTKDGKEHIIQPNQTNVTIR